MVWCYLYKLFSILCLFLQVVLLLMDSLKKAFLNTYDNHSLVDITSLLTGDASIDWQLAATESRCDTTIKIWKRNLIRNSFPDFFKNGVRKSGICS